MKKTVFVIGLCAVLLAMPTLLAFPTSQSDSLLVSPLTMSDGTFSGGFGRGHWGNGFHVDTVTAYMAGVYTSGVYTKISGEITNSYNQNLGEINAYIIHKLIFGYTQNAQGQRAPIIVLLMTHQNDQFVGRIMVSSFKPAPHIWGYFIPNI